MYVKFGSYKHDVGECELNLSREILETDARTPYAEVWRADISGMLLADNQASMDQKVEALLRAYSKANQDFVLYLSDGTPSYINMRSRNAIGGVRVVRGPSFPSNRNAAYVTYLPYSIALEAEFPFAQRADALRSFQERIVRSGGGPKFSLTETLNTRPIPQRNKVATIYHATQSGNAVGLYAMPTVPAPIWPQWLVEAPKIEVGSPKRIGTGRSKGYTDFTVSWQYTFQSVTPLYGYPTRWR